MPQKIYYDDNGNEIPDPYTVKSKVGKVWEDINAPLWTGPSRAGKAVADKIDNPLGEGGYLQGFIAGATQGTGDLLSGLTSKLNLATMGLGGLEATGIRGLSQAAGLLNKGVGAATAASGAQKLGEGNIGQGLMEFGGGLAGMHGMPARSPEAVVGDVLPGIRTGNPNPPKPTLALPRGAIRGNEPVAAPVVPEGNINQPPTYATSVRGQGGRFSASVGEPVIQQPDGSFLGVNSRKVYDSKGKVLKQGKGKVVTLEGDVRPPETPIVEGEIVTEPPVLPRPGTASIPRAAASINDPIKTTIFQETPIQAAPDINTPVKKKQGPAFSEKQEKNQLSSVQELLNSLMKDEAGSFDFQALKENVKRLFYDESGSAGRQGPNDYSSQIISQIDKAIASGRGLNAEELYEPWKGKLSPEEFTEHVRGYVEGQKLLKKAPPEAMLKNETTENLDLRKRIAQPEGQAYNSMDEVIENIKKRDDWDDKKKAKVIENLTKQDINPATGELPYDPTKLGRMNSWAKTSLTLDIPFISSAAGRQGLPLWYTKAFRSSLDDMVKSYGSENFFHSLMDGIREQPLFKTVYDDTGKEFISIAEQAGLHLPGVFNKLKDERFATNWLAKRAPFKANERAFHGFINKLRADHFQTLYDAAKASGRDVTDLTFLKDLANTVNIATGHGDLRSLKPIKGWLNKWMFSPSYTFSKLNMLDYRNYANLDPMIRRERIKNMAALVSASQAIGSLTYLAGEVLGSRRGTSSLENLSPDEWGDFGKTTFGNPMRGKTTFDSGAGILQPIALEAQMLLGMSKVASNYFLGTNYETDKYGKDVGTRTYQYAANRLNPVQRYLLNWATNKGYASDPKDGFNFTNELLTNVAPIMAQDVLDVLQANPELWPVVVPMSALGQGATSYTK